MHLLLASLDQVSEECQAKVWSWGGETASRAAMGIYLMLLKASLRSRAEEHFPKGKGLSEVAAESDLRGWERRVRYKQTI